MKSNCWKWIYNPFEFVAGWKAFGIGGALLMLTTLVGWLGNTVFFALEVKLTQGVTLATAFGLQAMGLVVTVVIMYGVAVIASRNVRFQDILGCVTLAKYPLLAVAFLFWLFGATVGQIDPELIVGHSLPASDYVALIAMGILGVVTLVWTIALLYNAFRVSTNLKGAKCIVLFVIVLLAAEIVAVLLAGYLY